jgi:hypothetical protein
MPYSPERNNNKHMKFEEGEVDPPKEEDLLKQKEPLAGA